MGTRKFRRAGCQVLASAESPPPLTRQYREHPNGASDVTGIAGEFDDGRGAGLHQRAITVALIGAQHLAQFFGHGDGDVEVRHWQHLRPAAFKPLLGLGGVALRATAIATRVPGEHLGIALFATPDLATECGGAAVEDVFDGAPV
jgi:hypothetical protein